MEKSGQKPAEKVGVYKVDSRRKNSRYLLTGQTETGDISSTQKYRSHCFDGKAGDRVTILMTALQGNFAPKISLYAPDSDIEVEKIPRQHGSHVIQGSFNEIDAGYYKWAIFENHALRKTGTYLIVCSPVEGKAEGTYGISLLKNPDTLSTSQQMQNGKPYSAVIEPGEQHVYTFSGNRWDSVQILLRHKSGQLLPQMELHAPDGSVEARTDEIYEYPEAYTITHSKALRKELLLWEDHELKQTGPYFVVCRDLKITRGGEYGISMMKTPGNPDGGVIRNDETQTGRLDFADMDGFCFEGCAGDAVTVFMGTIEGDLIPRVELHSPDGSVEIVGKSARPAQAQVYKLQKQVTAKIPDYTQLTAIYYHLLEYTGTYYLICRDDAGKGTGEYGVSLFQSPANSATRLVNYENIIRANPKDKARVAEARKKILEIAGECREPVWREINQSLADYADIDGACYSKGKLTIWGPISEEDDPAMPPLLIDDFVTAIRILRAGESPTISIGTVHGQSPSQEETREMESMRRYPVDYTTQSVCDTHMGSLLFEADRVLKVLNLGQDNITRRPMSLAIPGYKSLPDLIAPLEIKKGSGSLGRWWFEPERTGVAVEGSTMKIVRYRMVLLNEAQDCEAAVKAFGDHVNDHFEEYAQNFVVLRELVRMHKLVQVARWYLECRFPTHRLDGYTPLDVRTPLTTRSQRLPVNKQYFVTGGVNFSAPNCYIAASAIGNACVPGKVATWSPDEANAYSDASLLGQQRESVATFAGPIFQAMPSSAASAWLASVGGRKFAVVSIATSQAENSPESRQPVPLPQNPESGQHK